MVMTSLSENLPLPPLAFPVMLIAVLGAVVAGQLGYYRSAPGVTLAEPVTVTVSGPYRYRDYGEFYRNGLAVDAPMVEAVAGRPLAIMKYQVSEGDYERCVADGQCQPVEAAHVHGADFPVTGVSFADAEAYARWLTTATGTVWTLPSHDQLALAAGSRFPDDALGIDPGSGNPALRWLADYDRETRRKAERDTAPRRRGGFGENEAGLADFAGNVWEWTTTCHRRVEVNGTAASATPSCGTYVTVGQHRSPMSFFVRDPKTGGCSVGAPPANLGFRLVRDDRWYADILWRLRERGVI